MLIRWIARPDACDECKRIAAGSPYEKLPTWPGLGDTSCVCRCSVEGTRAGNVMAMAGAAPSPVSEPLPSAAAPASMPTSTPRTAPADVPPEPSDASLRDDEPDEPRIALRAPGRISSLPSLTSFRVKPLERRWALALGALIFMAAFVALFSTH